MRGYEDTITGATAEDLDAAFEHTRRAELVMRAKDDEAQALESVAANIRSEGTATFREALRRTGKILEARSRADDVDAADLLGAYYSFSSQRNPSVPVTDDSTKQQHERRTTLASMKSGEPFWVPSLKSVGAGVLATDAKLRITAAEHAENVTPTVIFAAHLMVNGTIDHEPQHVQHGLAFLGNVLVGESQIQHYLDTVRIEDISPRARIEDAQAALDDLLTIVEGFNTVDGSFRFNPRHIGWLQASLNDAGAD